MLKLNNYEKTRLLMSGFSLKNIHDMENLSAEQLAKRVETATLSLDRHIAMERRRIRRLSIILTAAKAFWVILLFTCVLLAAYSITP